MASLCPNFSSARPLEDSDRLMVEEVSSVIVGGPGWVLPLEESLQTAQVLDSIRHAAVPAGD